MEKQAAEFAAFQTEYNTLKGRYDTLMGKWDETGALSTEEQQEVAELEARYLADQKIFDDMEKNRVAKERENLQKELNKFKLSFDDATKALKAAQKAFEDQQKANTQATADAAKYEATIQKLEQQNT
jgi:chromosome segregation ATPase